MSTTLIIPDLDEAVEQKLRNQAASHGRSFEAEVRDILEHGVLQEQQGSKMSQERMRKAIESARGIWAGRMTTDQIMELTRGDESDDAYSRR